MSDRLVKVTMNLTAQDMENVAVICGCPNVAHRTHAVVTACAFTAAVAHYLRAHPNAELLLSNGDKFLRVVMPELEPQRDKPKVHSMFSRFLKWLRMLCTFSARNSCERA